MGAPFAVPATLAGHAFSARCQTAADLPFVQDLYVAHRWDELRAVAWTDGQRLAFLEEQFRGQWRHYETAYAGARFLILEVEAAPAGRLYLYDEHPRDLRIVEIGLAPRWRGHGLGGAVLRLVQDYAARRGKSCSIHVERGNPARRLYERLGFREVRPVGPYLLLEWGHENTAW